MIGVATADLRNRPDKFDNERSLCVDAEYGTLFSDGYR